MASMEPKPTLYRGTHYRSRLEARWAVYLDHHPDISAFRYEPVTFRVYGHSYTPDFSVIFKKNQLILEIKPAQPADNYTDILTRLAYEYTDFQFLIAVGSFYKEIPRLIHIQQELKPPMSFPMDTSNFFNRQAYQAASGYRFDLKNPETRSHVRKKRRRR
jgi:hypothetical protein